MIPVRYTQTAIALHWLTALLVVAAFPLGVYMADLALSPLKLKLISYHKWLGVTVFLLILLRLAWRVSHVPPPLPDSMPLWQRHAANGLHLLLYLLLFAIPLTGWLMSSAKGFQTVYLGVLPLPDLIGKDKALGDVLRQVHEMLNMTLLVLLLAHVAAALKHHFIERDGILARMLPFLERGDSK
ncbi:MAG: cytochrome b [Sulfurimicrobium sp.]|jgi:cytochrome b561|nr:cytochrome b [Sulfurimicrobium sp.]MDO9190925.1 cytochrome b [Sulfurimicrobium sp.]MDP1703797.1 cytochrome b [Sulfurimicrobium sp.]MDP1897172.1 cytochrome b [Sulfurimicrobium sp.]MDP2198513.1 cytochrome b [Sulfurimicrobium sp.]